MCLVVLAIVAHEQHPLIVAGNRDEFHSRPTLDADWWDDEPAIAGGRDLLAGGAWLAVHRSGRLAVVTNLHGEKADRPEPRSRGHLVTGFLLGDAAPLDYLASIDGDAYNGFNLLVAADGQVASVSNRGDAPRLLPPGVHGIGNGRMDAAEDKVRSTVGRLEKLLEGGDVSTRALLELLGDRRGTPPTRAPFVVQPDFGTRCSTIVTIDGGGRWQLLERRFDPQGRGVGESLLSFDPADDGQ